MNIEIANRLQKLRKEKGYSQEELADALGISRQAVSKWERAEASPDTDNLICLAKLYNVSLDSLLDTDETVEEIKEEQKEKAEEARVESEKVDNDDKDTFLRDDEGNFVHIGKDGVHIKSDDGSEIHVGKHGFQAIDEDGHIIKREKKFKVSAYVSGILMLFAIIGYLLIGFLIGYWEVAWVLFLVPELIGSIVRCFEKKRYGAFNMPILCTIVFITVSMLTGLWHPMWVVFLLVPVYYTIVGPIDNHFKCSCNCCKEVEEPKVDE